MTEKEPPPTEDSLREMSERRGALIFERHKNGELLEPERFWADLEPWLREAGYALRERYRPGWVASWVKESPLAQVDDIDFIRLSFTREDAAVMPVSSWVYEWVSDVPSNPKFSPVIVQEFFAGLRRAVQDGSA